MRRFGNWLHYLFVPSERNNLKAKVLHNDFLTVYLVIALLLVFTLKSFKAQITNVLGFATDISVSRLYELTNDQRRQNGLQPLAYNDQLAAAAALKAQDMFGENYWAHFSPSGKSPWQFILAAGYKYQYAGENLAKNYLFSNDVVQAWMNSPTHRENIVRGEFQDVGFAVVNGVLNGEETTLVVQMFGSQTETRAPPPVAQTQPENSPSPSPQLSPKVTATPAVLAKVQDKSKPVLLADRRNLSKYTFNISYIFIGFILLVLIFDLYFAYRLNIFRISSKNLAHIIFLLFIIAGFVFYITKGAII